MPNLRPLRVLLLRIGVIALVFSIQRLLFAQLNHDAFPAPPASAFLGGVRFDLSAIAWLYLPWVLTVLIAPAPKRTFATVQKVLFHLSNVFCFFLNSTDLEYFKFTLKRSTADLFGIATGGDDLANLAPVFLKDYWYVVLIFIGSLALAEAGYRLAGRRTNTEPAKPWWLWRVLAIGIVLLLSRGGLQYIPLGVLDASTYAPPAYMPLVLNTPFTFMTSIGKPMVQEKHFMAQEEADRLWPVIHHYGDTSVAATKPNVVVIVLESFSAAYSGRLNGTGQGYMPFLDSLMGQSLWCEHAYANGRRSIDGIPAVLASLPKMMAEAFIESPYAQQPISALPGLLGKEGYSSAFFHGGHNGTMGFDAFAKAAGFQRYVGRDQYPDEADDDGVWGIRDRPFLQFFAQELNKQQQPFLGCLFTLSSHHPYKLPEADAKHFAGGNLPIMPTLRYADDALRQFFATAQTMPWYRNTLFVITADHTADLLRNGETSGAAFDHWIPLLYFMPAAIRPEQHSRVTQQIDILPTVLDLVDYPKPFFAFGSSVLRQERMPAAVSENSATWLIIGDSCQLRSDGENILWSAGMNKAKPQAHDQQTLLPVLQAAIQQYNNRLLHHELVLKEK
ncbi:MAG: LTA synthase family protein [Flavobacteriales bacterium]|nr:LTA synthase family protein [Flavobacteriales bacterium]QQS73273.1 MAG: LTA synthase family protein [Flavobacteriales bacterium]HQV38032.1 LTA synthase family protein [Flavobacteriales bacterium]HQW32976.1 LTA synthase family protein [Flavobacteriales bacterium]HQY01712.1 LTA synthase family protein [Flavobacteriales bacterium]